jgi:hypothetical protein
MARGNSRAESEKASRASQERKRNLIPQGSKDSLKDFPETNNFRKAARQGFDFGDADTVVKGVEFEGRIFNVAATTENKNFGTVGYFGDDDTYGWTADDALPVRITETLKDGREVEIPENSANARIWDAMVGNSKVIESVSEAIRDNEPPSYRDED